MLALFRSLVIDSSKLKGKSELPIKSLIDDLETLGLQNPMNKIYRDLPHSSYFALFWTIFVIATIPKMFLFGNSNNRTVLKRIGQKFDGKKLLVPHKT